MLCTRTILAATLLFSVPQLSSAACIPFDQAQKHIGETQCVTGKVIRVEAGADGVHYLDFCEDHRLCSFSAVIFPYDLKNVGDVRQLAGKNFEIRGELKSYDEPRGDNPRECAAVERYSTARSQA